ncbi:anaphase-promoting complex subunit 16-like [Ptychodera flava]|uniref:anaphase-promoting complex subunit 16-like n=1 Tax=Ptychodera flava TaxID=63121 RepID=UPI00396A9C71
MAARGTSRTSPARNEPRKALFRSPAPFEDTQSSGIDLIITCLCVEREMDQGIKNTQKELHKQRLVQMKELLAGLQENEWRYKPIDKLIGL